LPFITWVDNDVESVLIAQDLEHADKKGGEHSVFHACRLLYMSGAHVVYLLQRRLPDSFALELRVLLQALFTGHNKFTNVLIESAATAGRSEEIKKLGDEEIKKLGDMSAAEKKTPKSSKNQISDAKDKEAGHLEMITAKTVKAHRIVRLESCSISAANLREWLPFFLLCRHLVLADNPLERPSLMIMRKRLKPGRSFGVFGLLWSFVGHGLTTPNHHPTNQKVEKLERLDFLTTSPTTPDIALELLLMAYDLNMQCTLGKGRQFSFTQESIENVLRKYYPANPAVKDGLSRVKRGGLTEVCQIRRDALNFLNKDLREVSTKSGERWDELNKAFNRFQLRQFGSCASDLLLLYASDPVPVQLSLPRAYMLLVRLCKSANLNAITAVEFRCGKSKE
jgi:hypothetical protein